MSIVGQGGGLFITRQGTRAIATGTDLMQAIREWLPHSRNRRAETMPVECYYWRRHVLLKRYLGKARR